ncbi:MULTISPECIES: helix-turn-helix domain-containing protein [Streptococcus]|uniref:helix-turn-helix domain-containing protein n=1 Tax=Streptococcus TaxID=1301 RepID=UPI00069D12B5|nr:MULTISPECIES: helix-turn-helix transcriptional regulator [Streptococcus]MCY7235083.1 helix-turn-helix domain-containing protein [Streptococcus dysgalactiae]QQC50520.1 helix-turn-helix transcriptional regulator [Streptococcus dysgalactiae]SUN66604.1 phage-associated protein [Streptococcus dysgalactiae subsp. equisimilis]VUC99236.1 phage-associated protein [Streptococcus sp. NCTC 11567]
MVNTINRLNELRKRDGISLKKLSDELKNRYEIIVSSSQLMYYEKGERQPRNGEIWEKLAEYFNVPLSYLLAYDKVVDTMKEELPNIQKAVNTQYDSYYNMYKQADKQVDELVNKLIKQLDPDKYSTEEILSLIQPLITQVTILQETIKILLKLKDRQAEGEIIKNKIENFKTKN